jgi:hypothetical protein
MTGNNVSKGPSASQGRPAISDARGSTPRSDASQNPRSPVQVLFDDPLEGMRRLSTLDVNSQNPLLSELLTQLGTDDRALLTQFLFSLSVYRLMVKKHGHRDLILRLIKLQEGELRQVEERLFKKMATSPLSVRLEDPEVRPLIEAMALDLAKIPLILEIIASLESTERAVQEMALEVDQPEADIAEDLEVLTRLFHCPADLVAFAQGYLELREASTAAQKAIDGPHADVTVDTFDAARERDQDLS